MLEIVISLIITTVTSSNSNDHHKSVSQASLIIKILPGNNKKCRSQVGLCKVKIMQVNGYKGSIKLFLVLFSKLSLISKTICNLLKRNNSSKITKRTPSLQTTRIKNKFKSNQLMWVSVCSQPEEAVVSKKYNLRTYSICISSPPSL